MAADPAFGRRGARGMGWLPRRCAVAACTWHAAGAVRRAHPAAPCRPWGDAGRHPITMPFV